MFRTFCILTILFSCLAVQAQDAPTPPDAPAQPKSLAAKQAETKFNLDMQKLDAEYQQKAAAIKQSYIDGLKTAMKTLAKNDNADSDEIAKLSAKIKEVQAMVAQVPTATPQVKRINGRWRSTWGKGGDQGHPDNWIFKANSIVCRADGNEVGKWMQDGPVVMSFYSNGKPWDHLFLSNDGRIMKGVNWKDPSVTITYTFVGD